MAANNFNEDVVDIHAEPAESEINEEGFDECLIYKDYVFVDIQGFKRPKNYLVCKEFCLLDDTGYKFHAIVKSSIEFKRLPSIYKRQAIWLMNNHHRIDYDAGDIDPFDLRDQMYPKVQNKIVLVKGLDKIRWLKHMFRLHGEIVCLDIDSLDFDVSLKKEDPYDICEYHNRIFGWTQGPCAMSTALLIQDLAYKNIDKLP